MKTIIEMAQEAGIIHPEMVDKTLEAFAALVRADEREACARVCEDHFSSDGDWCAKAIRAGKNT
jgi:hypothetical protein